MSIFKFISDFFGGSKRKTPEVRSSHAAISAQGNQCESLDKEDHHHHHHHPHIGFTPPHRPVPVVNPGPVLIPVVRQAHGGVQGLHWYANNLRVDSDGDIAEEFITEVLLEGESKPRFEVNREVSHVIVREQALTDQGQLLHCVQHMGNLHWIS